MQKELKENGAVPTIRRMNKAGVVSTKELYDLFPGGPAKKAAKIAGLPKPVGCV
jgi:TusE/DsrC/DsvC family sulfur relay protein